MAQMNEQYQVVATQPILVDRINTLLVLVFSWDLMTMKKIEYWQPCPLTKEHW